MAQNNSGQTSVYRFIARMVIGIFGAMLIGLTIDNWLGTTPWILLCLIAYVICGSLYLLVRDLK